MPTQPELARRFGAVYPAALADVLDGLGYLHQTLPAGIAPFAPGMRLAGPAFAVEGRPRPGADYETSIRRIPAMLGHVGPATSPSTPRTTVATRPPWTPFPAGSALPGGTKSRSAACVW